VSSTSNCRAARGRQADANHPASRICCLQLSKIALVSNPGICRDALQLYGNAQLSFLRPLKI